MTAKLSHDQFSILCFTRKVRFSVAVVRSCLTLRGKLFSIASDLNSSFAFFRNRGLRRRTSHPNAGPAATRPPPHRLCRLLLHHRRHRLLRVRPLEPAEPAIAVFRRSRALRAAAAATSVPPASGAAAVEGPATGGQGRRRGQEEQGG
jgi:hypothetical protein